jgi:carboxyl-terminal processing protease
MPVVVLVDGRSASASEIVAGTLQDLDRAVVVGQESFGKGLVQQTVKLAYGTRMKVTVAKYYTPSGRCVQRLDYSHRDDEGQVHAAADSTLNTFYTRNGREVIEGRGVIPDVEIPAPEMKYVLQGLLEHHTMFDFVVANRDNFLLPDNPIEFHLNPDIWEQFISYVEGLKDVPYTSKTAKAYEALVETANDELLAESNQSILDRLQTGLKPNVRADLKRHESSIKQALEAEIVAHRYGKTGEYMHGLLVDPVALKALDILGSAEYESILAGPTKP